MLDGFIFLAYLPITYLILKWGGTPYSPFLFMIALEIIKSNYYTKLLKANWTGFKLFEFYRKGRFPLYYSVWYYAAILFCYISIVCGRRMDETPFCILYRTGCYSFFDSLLFLET